MKNPNRYGTITKLSGKRRSPYWVRTGDADRKTIGYTETREEAILLLAEWNKSSWDIDADKMTLEALYNLWLDKRAVKLNPTTVRPLKSAYRYISHLGDLRYNEIKAYQMQESVDRCDKGYSMKNTIKSLWTHLDHIALELDIVNKQYSSLIKSEKIVRSEKHIFTIEEVRTLWQHQEESMIDSILILLYSGFRISELLMLTKDRIDLEQGIMVSGVKTEAGKDRVVPIHHIIYPLVKKRYEDCDNVLFPYSPNTYRNKWDKIMEGFGMSHTPHECRHTFRSWMDSAGANKVCIDLIMGHKSQSVGERIYTHKTIQELKEAIELVTNW